MTPEQIEAALAQYNRSPEGLQRFLVTFVDHVEEWPEAPFFYWHDGDGVRYRLQQGKQALAASLDMPEATDIVLTGMPAGAGDRELSDLYVRDAKVVALIDAVDEAAARSAVLEAFPTAAIHWADASTYRSVDQICEDPSFEHPAVALGRKAPPPLYRREFADYDDEIPHVPGFHDRSWKNEACPCFDNSLAGFRLWHDYKEPNVGDEAMHLSRTVGGAKRYSLHRVHDEFDIGRDELIGSSDSLDEILAIYAKEWFSDLAVEIGIGFHPDTSVENYEPPLPSRIAAQYEDMRQVAFDHLEDPYAVGLEAWEKAGLIERAPVI